MPGMAEVVMRKVWFWLLVSSMWAAPALGLGVDEVVARHLQALGGDDKLLAIKTLRLTGKATFGGGDGTVEAAWGQVQKRDAGAGIPAIRNEVTLQGLTAVDAGSAKEGWSLDPFEGRREPRRASADEVKGLGQDADLDGPLLGWKEKGHKVEYLGTEDVDGTPAHKLRIRLKDGDVVYDFLDPQHFLLIREVRERHIRGAERVSETDLGNYAQVAGVWLPFSVESGRKGRPRSARYAIEHAEVNVPIDDAVFQMPAPGTPIVRVVLPDPHAATPAVTPPPASEPTQTVMDSAVISGLGARNIGSAAMSGRVAALAAHHAGGKTTLYVGAASGGVWKSTDGGTTFQPVFDRQPVQSIGAIALDPSRPSTVWVGTGEAWTRNSVSVGAGIFKSLDSGATWENMGLPESERIARILVHPKDGNTVYVCVPGKLWSDSADRGVYRTTDGGKTWGLVLRGSNLSTGCSGLTMDPKDPRVLLAGLWDFRRQGWTFRSGGDGPDAPSGSALYRTSDGGTTWSEVTAKGLPPKPWGRVEVAIAPSDPKIVYGFIESKDSALYRSSDGGVTWEARDKSQPMVWRPFYFARLVVDPTNAERLFKPDLQLIVSEDGGKSFSGSGGGSHGDWHDLWIDPENPKHVIGGDDGGLWLSRDGGNRWWRAGNLPISQFYHVAADDRDPYHVYGGLQDNSSWVGPSAKPGGITNAAWENLYDGDGFWTVPDPRDPDIVYAEAQGGFIGRIDLKTHATRDIQPKAGYHEKLRFNWNAPIHVSHRTPGTIYLGAQFLFRSRDRGDTWERISPDLTTNDPARQKQEQSGGVTIDNSSAEMHTTIYSISESPLDDKTVWVGTDDGNLQVTRDGGKAWTNVASRINGLPKGSWVSWVQASTFEPGTALAAFDRHTVGDMTPWVYRTADFGQTWTRIAGPEQGVRGYVHCITEDLRRKGLYFLGSEFGLWISIDAGLHWAPFHGGQFPSVAVREVQVHPRESDLVIATHGRGIWIVDDISPLRALDADVLGRDAVLPARPVQQRMRASGGWVEGDASFVGDNPASGAVITYFQKARHLFGPLKLEVLDQAGKVIDTLTASRHRGLNRVVWQMQVPPPRVPRAAQLAFGATQGPRVIPGTYTVRLTKGSQVLEGKLDVGLDHRAPYSLGDRKAQFEAAMKVHALFGDMSALVDRLDAKARVLQARRAALAPNDALAPRLQSLANRLLTVKKLIVATKEGGAITGEERIREHTDQLYGAILGWDGRPTRDQLQRIETLRRELDDVKTALDAIDKDALALVEPLRNRHLEPLVGVAAGQGVTDAPAPAALGCWRARLGTCETGHQAARH
jgi:photosystem II stability/assembly factor-like uncharacterized protein